MKSTGLVRRLAALGAGVAMAATMATGVLASPAAASSSKSSAKPKVSATTPKASPKHYEGECPVEITFSAKVKVKAVKKKTTVVYRWLRGDGSKSKIKSYRLTGKGTKHLTLKEQATFRRDTKGWQRLQVLSPRKVTTAKGYFSVDCEGRPPVHHDPQYVRTYVNVEPDRYVGECTPYTRIGAKGVITVGRPAWVRYRWVQNGHVVDYGKTKVYDSKRVYHSFKARDTHRGYVALEVLSPEYSKAKDHYSVRCEDERPEPRVSARVSGPSDYAGTCPVARTFNGSISVNTGRTAVEYRWAGPGYRGPVQRAYFRHAGSESVNHTVRVGESDKVHRWIEILGPGDERSNTASARVRCASEPDAKAWIVSLSNTADKTTCNDETGPSVKHVAKVRVTGATTLSYRWEVNGSASTEIERSVKGPGVESLAWGSGPDKGDTTKGTVRLVLTAPNGDTASETFSHTC
ncbi:hypothetical protein C1I98_20035 [Spongiactinospora gelatinilytica]|uniref:Ig-like domain-containing protein n=1 Tax=Spongiactinospora gelatinilytica TaxID=2666298 RepID=A0A2W2G2Q7_9ACTN|nr:hypothetical protein [Spongiactinospora gelatinilytica]PZG42283.1 hypothetical protein C1I98_20035 [Spongiactinospora gelatinilytica]